MKKVYTTAKFKAWQKKKISKVAKNIKRRKDKKARSGALNLISYEFRRSYERKQINPTRVFAPKDFRLIENTEECLLFFRSIRSEDNINKYKKIKFVMMSLVNVEQIDYAAISALSAISDDLKYQQIILHGDFPINLSCRKFIIDSNFLNRMVNEKNQKFPKVVTSDLIFFEQGCGILSDSDNRNISGLVKNVVNHLTGEANHCLPVKTIILEICGNSIEWAKTENKQWLLGAKYELDKVIFTVTDVGNGILGTLHKKFGLIISDFLIRSDLAILKRAFEQKYGSKTQEVNRNKGLPSVKANFDRGTILRLKVLTNNVILHFDNETASKTLATGAPRFRGTLYQFEMTKHCINQALII